MTPEDGRDTAGALAPEPPREAAGATPPEPDLERELREHAAAGRLHWFDVDRRGFLKTLGGGVLVCLCAPAARAQPPAGESGRGGGRGSELPQDLAAWLHVGEDGGITVLTGKVEMGQNIRTSLAQQVAEELRVPVAAVTMVMGDTGLTPWDAGTFGSRTTPTMAPQLRAAAATAREMLVDLAARRWNAERAALVAGGGRIANPATGQALAYGELVREPEPRERLAKVRVLAPGQGAPLAPASEWKVAGTAVPKVGGRDFVTGGHRYTSDLARPGMLHGKVLRPAGFQAKLLALDTGRAAQIPGVKIVRDGDFVGAVAADAGTAQQAVEALAAQWQVPPQPSNRELFEYLKQHEDAGAGADAHVAGSVEQAAATAAIKLAQTYTVEYIAHSPLEPRAAVAEWEGDRLTVWTGTQRPFAVRDELAEVLRIPADRVRVMVPDTGSAYGGKHTGDAAVEAARLARPAGKPVKLVWTREEELTWAYFRPAGVIEVRSAARADGTLLAWEHHNYNSGGAAIGTPYEVANQRIQFHPARSPLRQGSYRGLAATANHFARESHMDELAHAAGIEPLRFRLQNLANPRLRAVLEAAAAQFGWGKRQPAPGAGFGIAGGTEKGGFVATCAEVLVEPGGRPRLLRVVEAFECGAVVNPNGLRNQVEGAVVQAIGGALFEAIEFGNGRILNSRFAKYRLPRFADVPQIEVVILDRKDLPSAGAGETPIVGLAPAVGNAIFAATGVRLRGLPMAPYGVPRVPQARS
ncbi:MAG: xanthine dehydrogenase family protein molybdopterin-binding subunit [Acidobacteria bacterium]|nr:xanthine dehydrogenase family protein molybdopterin-binding subunit [Acidobacteriota bacterium]